MLKNAIIAALAALVVLLTARVVSLENYHYASFVGMCSQYNPADPMQTVKRHTCLHETETRTSWLWHLLYAIKGE